MTSVYKNPKGTYFVSITDFRNRSAPRIGFNGTTMPDRRIGFITKEPGNLDSFIVDENWCGGIYYDGHAKDDFHFGIKTEGEWEPYTPAVNLNFYRILLPNGRMLVVKAPDREKAALWAEGQGIKDPKVEGATWDDTQLVKSLGGEIYNTQENGK